MSIGIGMCPQSQWEKVTKGSWVRSMSPFDNRLLDLRTTGSSLDKLEVSIEEGILLFNQCIYSFPLIFMLGICFFDRFYARDLFNYYFIILLFLAELFSYRIICLILGIVLMSLSSSLSNSLIFYYGSAISIGVILVILIILFQVRLLCNF